MNKNERTWAKTKLNEVSRTFALSIKELPDTHEDQMTVAYLLCRVADTIEDTDLIPPSEKKQLLNKYKSVIEQDKSPEEFVQDVRESVPDITDDPDNSDWKLVLEFERLHEIFSKFSEEEKEIMREWVGELTEGMKDFVVKHENSDGVRIQSKDELDEYCYYVAGTVGHMIIDLLDAAYNIPYEEYSYEEVHELAEQYGLMLQYINITKDVYDDYNSEDNIYIPNNIISDFDLTQTEFITSDHNKTEKIIEKINNTTEKYLESSEQFLHWIQNNHEDSYRGWAIPHFLAVATLRELKDKAELAIEPEEVKIDRKEVQKILTKIQSKDVIELRKNILQEDTV